jgi:DNA-binding NtrC family response regulator
MTSTVRRTVLLVDTDAPFARSLQILIEDEMPCRVRVAHSAADALGELERGGPAEVVVSDAATALARLLPRCDRRGESLAQASLVEVVRRLYPGTGLILLTAHRAELASAEAERLGRGRVLLKPVDPAALLECVAGALEPGESRDGPSSGATARHPR